MSHDGTPSAHHRKALHAVATIKALALLLTAAMFGCVTETAQQSQESDMTEAPSLSYLGEAVYQAVQDSNQSATTVPHELALSTRNVAVSALVEGPEIFPALAELIAAARHEVDIEMFDWEWDSDASRTLLDGIRRLQDRLLSDAEAPRPVVVRILVSSNHTSGAGHIIVPLLEQIDTLGLEEQLVRVEAANRPAWTLGVMHQKLAVIDGRWVHIGGANVQAYHDYDLPWHDSAYVLGGEIATTLLRDFDKMWTEGDTWSCTPGTLSTGDPDCWSHSNGRADHPPEVLDVDPALTEGIEPTTFLPMIALVRRPNGWPNNDIDNAQDRGLVAAMDAARQVIKIETPNLNDDRAKRAISEAVERGVEVRIILSLGFNDKTESYIGQGGTNAENAAELYERALDALGAERAVELLQIRWYSRDGVAPVDGRADGHGEGASHAKYMSVDGQLTIVGSANMDTQSWNQSGEANVAIDSAEVTERFDARVFDSDWNRAIAVDPYAAP